MSNPLLYFDGEKVITLKEVPGLGCWAAPISYTAVLRWRKKGLKGVRLETRRNGGSIITSVEAVERFIERTQ